jgi:hypothetical protein
MSNKWDEIIDENKGSDVPVLPKTIDSGEKYYAMKRLKHKFREMTKLRDFKFPTTKKTYPSVFQTKVFVENKKTSTVEKTSLQGVKGASGAAVNAGDIKVHILHSEGEYIPKRAIKFSKETIAKLAVPQPSVAWATEIFLGFNPDATEEQAVMFSDGMGYVGLFTWYRQLREKESTKKPKKEPVARPKIKKRMVSGVAKPVKRRVAPQTNKEPVLNQSSRDKIKSIIEGQETMVSDVVKEKSNVFASSDDEDEKLSHEEDEDDEEAMDDDDDDGEDSAFD